MDATKCVVPLAAFVTPAKKLPNMPVLTQRPWWIGERRAVLGVGVDQRAFYLQVCCFIMIVDHVPHGRRVNTVFSHVGTVEYLSVRSDPSRSICRRVLNVRVSGKRALLIPRGVRVVTVTFDYIHTVAS